MTDSEPRLPPLPIDQWDEQARAMLRGRLAMADRYLSGEPDAPPLPNVLGLLGHHPELAAAWLTYNSLLLERATLDPRCRELVILRVAWRSGSRYEWEQHVRIGLRAGLSPAQIAAVRQDPSAELWTPLERLLLTAADQLMDRHRIDGDTWTELGTHLDTRQLMELMFVTGSYLCLAMVFNSADLQPDPGAESLPAALEFAPRDARVAAPPPPRGSSAGG
ncbi:carboxymuconolactone decarboxylase family protein [Nocardia gipuzkoensis]|uniref:carboxymuconolactone decarboxylase family protein n=1 Tax=Nocardia gipuzkoensis TaxID=2749991 RepID=UPI00237E3AC2|nr:carboxymuconolactone decarboxylase family protein [Nocardia gipuzkoensis]MDE1674121.1 carboxymuconolactone decarboxylase family protein [Nocardia gipuzkoensis]